jgi:elongation factor Ts
MQVAATNPEFLKKEDISEDDKEKVKEVFAKQMEEEKKDQPAELKEKILQGKIDAYFKEKVLLEQMYIKDSSLSINNLIESAVQKFGEKTEVGHFVRFSIN